MYTSTYIMISTAHIIILYNNIVLDSYSSLRCLVCFAGLATVGVCGSSALLGAVAIAMGGGGGGGSSALLGAVAITRGGGGGGELWLAASAAGPRGKEESHNHRQHQRDIVRHTGGGGRGSVIWRWESVCVCVCV